MSDIKKLQEAGLTTIGSVLQTSTRDLIAIKGLTEARIEKIREAAKKLDCRGNAFKTGLEVKEKRKSIVKLTTGKILKAMKDTGKCIWSYHGIVLFLHVNFEAGFTCLNHLLTYFLFCVNMRVSIFDIGCVYLYYCHV